MPSNKYLLRAAQRAALKQAILTEDAIYWAVDFLDDIPDEALDRILAAVEAAVIPPEELPIPLAYYEWLATIDKDTRIHDLTHEEITALLTLNQEKKP